MFTIFKVVYLSYGSDTNRLLMMRSQRLHLILVTCGQGHPDCELPNQYCKFNNDTDATNNTNGACEGKLTKRSIYSIKLNCIFYGNMIEIDKCIILF